MKKIEVRIWNREPDEDDLKEFVLSGPEDYGTETSRRLYEALGAREEDDEYVLCRRTGDGRLALIGLTCQGHEWATEAKGEEETSE